MADKATSSSPRRSRKKASTADGTASSGRAKAREGKKAIVGYFTPELNKRIQIIALEEGVSMQAVLGEALDMLLEDRGQAAARER